MVAAVLFPDSIWLTGKLNWSVVFIQKLWKRCDKVLTFEDNGDAYQILLSLKKPDLFTVQISRTKVDYIDTKNINPDMALGFFLDFLTGDKSTIRNVFGILYL